MNSGQNGAPCEPIERRCEIQAKGGFTDVRQGREDDKMRDTHESSTANLWRNGSDKTVEIGGGLGVVGNSFRKCEINPRYSVL
jgi:hypothetical protein